MNRGTLNTFYTPVGALSAGGFATGVAAGIGCIYVNSRLTKELAIQNTEIIQLRAELAKATKDIDDLRILVHRTVKDVKKTTSEMKSYTRASEYSTRGSRSSTLRDSSHRRTPSSRRGNRSVQASETPSEESEIDEFFANE